MLLLVVFVDFFILLGKSLPFNGNFEHFFETEAEFSTKSKHAKHENKVLPCLQREQRVISICLLKLKVLVAYLIKQRMLY